ncbi:hypoxanthine phosphoribosyltransferase [Bacteriovorax sp. DB6_IX]|uniref:hypoxanthine phosphoribosyltransferase n=1 Tax=Bacteriovorax sp. DB6_IX TaxID=1353530 RepID=UPI000389EC50|nr:hypoxanthine phosphoribosyltransferase [Bacteriovorax sp. DB6_IX]EQC51381.1 hypoxanthine phosphoribosyltransferase [Bacteriovorax sp. DB6_IX]
MSVSTYISAEKIQARVEEIARIIDMDYNGEEVVVIGVLNGSFMFVADLIRAMETPVFLDFIAVSSYEGTESTGELKMLKDVKVNVEGKHVLLVEDIVDTGLTISKLKTLMEGRSPKSLKLASLLHKPARTEHKVDIDYLGFEIEDKFVIGYGLDFNGLYRELPYIGEYSAS